MKTIQFRGREFTLHFGMYLSRALSISLYDSDGAPYMTATVNIFENDANLDLDMTAIKDYSENIGILKCLRNNGLIKEDISIILSGFVGIPVVRVDLDKLAEYNPESMMSFLEHHHSDAAKELLKKYAEKY